MESNNLIYILKKRGLLASDSLKFIMDLYLPIIGETAAFLYLFLFFKINKGEVSGNYDDLIVKSYLSNQNFLLARQNLESIGLLNTYKKDDDSEIVFVINDPETPKNFFDNFILKGLFITSSNEEEYKRIMSQYAVDFNFKKYKDIGASVQDSYKIEFDYDVIENGKKVELVGRTKNPLKDNFSDVKLLNYLCKNFQLSANSLSEEEVNNIHRVATLHGLNEAGIGQLCGECLNLLNKRGNKIDILKLRKLAQIYVKNFDVAKIGKKLNTKKMQINSGSDAIKKVKYYESMSPYMFLREKQDGIDPVMSDRKIIDKLAFDMGLSDGMINALLDYTLTKCDGSLNEVFIMKVASTLIRKKVNDTLGVVENLYTKQFDNVNNIKNETSKNITQKQKESSFFDQFDDENLLDSSKYDDIDDEDDNI